MTANILSADYETLIFTVRGRKVMIDSDLAALYGVETRRLKEQVRRNIERFPEDFMFVLTNEEFDNLRSQIATSRWGGSRYLSMAFTEQGVAMLSSVLKSKKAISVNIEIMRAFARYRGLLRENEELRKEIIALDNKLNAALQFLLDRIDELHQDRNEPRRSIGYKYKKGAD